MLREVWEKEDPLIQAWRPIIDIVEREPLDWGEDGIGPEEMRFYRGELYCQSAPNDYCSRNARPGWDLTMLFDGRITRACLPVRFDGINGAMSRLRRRGSFLWAWSQPIIEARHSVPLWIDSWGPNKHRTDCANCGKRTMVKATGRCYLCGALLCRG